MKNAVFWDAEPCRYIVNRRFGGTVVYSYLVKLVHRASISYTLKMEAIRSSETSVNKIFTRRHIPEDGSLHSYRHENVKSYMVSLHHTQCHINHSQTCNVAKHAS
jgi:hypothetical protein